MSLLASLVWRVQRLLSIIAVLSLVTARGEAAVLSELQNCGPGCTVQNITITGDIDRATYEQFLQALAAPRPESETVYFAPQVRLNSPGGSAEMAMAIGEKLREANLTTVVSQGDRCEGACVLILAAGVIRVAVYGAVGIDKPTPEERVSGPAPVSTSVRQYLNRMGISNRLYGDMERVSSGDVRFLSASELREYRLTGADPAWMNAQSLNSRN